MARKPVPQPLTLSGHSALPGDEHHPRSAETLQVVSLPSADSHRSSPRTPRSPFSRFSPKKPDSASLHASASHAHSRALEDFDDDDDDDPQNYPPITSALHQPAETPTRPNPRPAPRHESNTAQPSQPRDQGRPSKSGFFFNLTKSSKPTHKQSTQQRQPQQLQQQHRRSESRGEIASRGTDTSVPSSKSAKLSDTSLPERSAQQSSTSQLPQSSLTHSSTGEYTTSASQSNLSKKNKPKPFGLLGRTKSARDNELPTPSPKEYRQTIHSPVQAIESTRAPLGNNSPGLMARPQGADRSFSSNSTNKMNSAARNRSEDRAPPLPQRDQSNKENQRDREPSRQHASPSVRDNGSFFGGLRNLKAADMISKGLFGKSIRSGSTTEREPIIDDEHYALKVINLPLVEQTRRTRISRKLEDSRDKTEFWMPAFPWRAIDYLNYKGCDVEGLYRVPGSGPQIKKWQRRFDEELDVNLFEQDDLYDINIIGSMLKAWLRELPDELFPKAAQERVAKECAGSDKVPQLLIDELSNLSPFNYYLLFAITCHLSLLLAHSDKNKMDFRNLCICFQPCMKIDAFCFRFLVCDWRECWKGCKAEAKYIEEEYLLLNQPPPRGVSESRKPVPDEQLPATNDERAVDRAASSSESSKQSSQGQDQQPKTRLKKKALPLSDSHGSNGSVGCNLTMSTTLTINSDQDAPRGSGDLRPLSPIKPLSPLGF
ncbi:Rho-type GTPase-activating protein 2 like [Verticillium longisporum]|nr:Rho-type GTPase-activating protein 2 like [Verticillium longisporum]